MAMVGRFRILVIGRGRVIIPASGTTVPDICGLQGASLGAGCKLQVAGYKLQVAGCKLQVAGAGCGDNLEFSL
jgi:hypothetical protein